MASETPRNDFGASQTGGTAGATAGSSTTGAGAAGTAREPDLQTQITKLREDIAGLSEAIQAKGSASGASARARAYELRDDVRDRGERYYKQAQDAAHDLEDQVSEKVRSEPIKSLAIAAAVGYLYARLFR